MNEHEEVRVPNMDLANPQHMISLSYARLEGGYLMRENFSKKRFPLSGFGFVAAQATAIGTILLKHLESRMPQMKQGAVLTVEIQVRDGGINPFGGSPSFLMMNPYGDQPAGYWQRQMQKLAFLSGLEPTIIAKYSPDQAGYINFTNDIQNDPNRGKKVFNNGFPGFDTFGGDDPFSFMPGLEDFNDSSNINKDVVEEIKKDNRGSIALK
jgi:hypothetical protein